jgi:hypothetical protein
LAFSFGSVDSSFLVCASCLLSLQSFFWIIHKIFGFVGEVVVHLLLGLAINKIYTKLK